MRQIKGRARLLLGINLMSFNFVGKGLRSGTFLFKSLHEMVTFVSLKQSQDDFRWDRPRENPLFPKVDLRARI